MHEAHLMRDMLSDLLQSARANNAKRVTKVRLRMGKFSEIDEDNIRFFLRENGRDTPVEGAEVEIDKSDNRELTLVSFDYE